MTACVNKKHTRRVALAISASLVGALSLGAAAPAVALAEGIDMQFATPEGVFSDGDVSATFNKSGMTYDSTADKAASVEFEKNSPVALDKVDVTFFDGVTGAKVDLTINATDETDDYEVAYYKRGDDGKPFGEEITSDVTEVGKYVAVVTAVSGNYEGGVVYVPFDITAISIKDIAIINDEFTYNAESHEVSFALNGEKLTEGIDYTVEYIKTGHDADPVSEIIDQGTYKAIVTGMGNYAGSVQLSDVITVNALNLNDVVTEPFASTDSNEIEKPLAIWIDGVRYAEGDPIIDKLQAQLANPQSDVWFENGRYTYNITPADPDDGNIEGTATVTGYKVAEGVTFTYDGAEWPAESETFVSDPSTKWDSSKVKAHTADGTAVPVAKVYVYNQNGVDCEAANINWSETPGTYTIVYKAIDESGYTYGGTAVTTLRVWQNTVDADAQAFVAYDGKVVNSIETVYEPGVDVTDKIKVSVQAEDKTPLDQSIDYSVKYYDSEGHQVYSIVDAGTYTLKVTSSKYKLSGTTEMTITVSPMDVSNVKASAVQAKPWDNAGNVTEYLPWEKDGVTLTDLGLMYLPSGKEDVAANYIDLPMDQIKVTILDSEGNEVKKIEDEGVYTIHFEARNDDAANNYVVPGDMTVTCIKDSHLKFADVAYTDYFADPVAYVSDHDFMFGYKASNLFGSYDSLTRGQVACVLYNMATVDHRVNETDLVYTEDSGYVTGFSDVNGKNYYGAAIAWARQAGVVNGYPDGTFKPEQTVTREEFCAMLANYASKFDSSYEAGDASSLDRFADASQVSGWATEVVAWGVENGIIGNGGWLMPTDTIIRADAACMVYNYADAE